MPRDFESSLPRFRREKSKDFPGWDLVYCLREGCPSKGETAFIVKRQIWGARRLGKGNTVIKGRVCVYCHRVSQM